ncbi:MAG: DNA/RNA nuclease SfsA [Candidatus Latescibacteria bacterium]|nr:DNA/RNA nuclease SfsA [Candidatus Latescibacterota bacterium]
MKFSKPLIPGTLIRRYKRFLADVALGDGRTVTAHCANTGTMLQVSDPGSPVMLSEAGNPNRKTRYDWQLVKVGGRWAGINTAVPNMLLREGFETGAVHCFRGYDGIRMEVKYGVNSRADALLTGSGGDCYVEAKNVTLVENGLALFPDAVTSRGAKHMDELSSMVMRGDRAVLFLLSQRMDSEGVGIADHIDPYYAERLAAALKSGVEVLAWRAKVTPEDVTLDCELPFIAP